MKQRAYVDTSVVGGYFEREFLESTYTFFEEARKNERILIISDLLEKELENAPEQVKKLLTTIPEESIEKAYMSQEAETLARKYIEAKVVGNTSLDDCRHIAIATLCKADVLVSWNFKHIVNIMRIKGYNGINSLNGYGTIEIRTPKEVLSYANNN